MRAVIFSMPDVVPHFFDEQWKIPAGVGPLLASNNPQHRIWQADLVTQRKRVREAIASVLREYKPEVVGLSAMSFQYDSACRTAQVVRATDPSIRIGIGGYHATVNYDVIAASPESHLFDFIVRGEGERTFGEALDRLEDRKPLDGVAGLSFRDGATWVHNGPRANLSLDDLRPPDRSVRIWKSFRYYGKQLDVFESTRGCTLPCNFCSITQMYGRTFRKAPYDFALASLEDAKRHGAQFAFLTDDNVVLDPKRFLGLCRAIIEHKHNDLIYLVQGSANGIAKYPELAEAMAEAGFKFVFLGIESASKKSLENMNADRKSGENLEYTLRAIELLRKNGILIIGGLILGLPDDTPEDFEENYRWYYEHGVAVADQVITPYPKTGQRQELEAGGYVRSSDLRRYNGFWANVQTNWMSPWEIEYWRWYYYRIYRSFRAPPIEWKAMSPLAYYIIKFVRAPWRRLVFALQNHERHFDRYQRWHARKNDLFGPPYPPLYTRRSRGGKIGTYDDYRRLRAAGVDTSAPSGLVQLPAESSLPTP
jgi:radical SAM superfamily enzyme YgiQ (UPF0313 family)